MIILKEDIKKFPGIEIGEKKESKECMMKILQEKKIIESITKDNAVKLLKKYKVNGDALYAIQMSLESLYKKEISALAKKIGNDYSVLVEKAEEITGDDDIEDQLYSSAESAGSEMPTVFFLVFNE